MIIIGYQGIGKSTLAKNKDFRVIDLESGNFFIDGKRSRNWYVIYCKIAKHLSDQGYIVLTSSHKEVREELKKYKEDTDIKVCVPALDLRNNWVIKLQQRYNRTKLEKDYKAYMNAFESYITNIKDIMDSGFEVIHIKFMDYRLEEVLGLID